MQQSGERVRKAGVHSAAAQMLALMDLFYKTSLCEAKCTLAWRALFCRCRCTGANRKTFSQNGPWLWRLLHI